MLADTDGNGVSDYNQCYGISTAELPSDTSSTPAQDSDGDGLDDSQESSLGTNPYDSDTDDDGLTDGFEASWGSSPTNSDSDNDGASDQTENSLRLQPGNPDTDSDGLADGFEVSYTGSLTLSANDADSGDDGISDYLKTNCARGRKKCIKGPWIMAVEEPGDCLASAVILVRCLQVWFRKLESLYRPGPWCL